MAFRTSLPVRVTKPSYTKERHKSKKHSRTDTGKRTSVSSSPVREGILSPGLVLHIPCLRACGPQVRLDGSSVLPLQCLACPWGSRWLRGLDLPRSSSSGLRWLPASSLRSGPPSGSIGLGGRTRGNLRFLRVFPIVLLPDGLSSGCTPLHGSKWSTNSKV